MNEGFCLIQLKTKRNSFVVRARGGGHAGGHGGEHGGGLVEGWVLGKRGANEISINR